MLIYEHHSQPVISHTAWLQRLATSLQLAVAVLAAVLLIGTLGYHFLGSIAWVDSLLEAAMILSGMGPVAVMQNDTVKIFAAFYALLSGFVLLSSFGVVMAPVLHRFLHHFHRANGQHS
jgi:hypothetical protein